MLRVLADLLDVKMTAHCEPFFTRRWIPGCMADSRRKFALYLCRTEYSNAGTDPAHFLSVGGQPLVDRTNADDENMQKEISLLKRSLKTETGRCPDTP